MLRRSGDAVPEHACSASTLTQAGSDAGRSRRLRSLPRSMSERRGGVAPISIEAPLGPRIRSCSRYGRAPMHDTTARSSALQPRPDGFRRRDEVLRGCVRMRQPRTDTYGLGRARDGRSDVSHPTRRILRARRDQSAGDVATVAFAMSRICRSSRRGALCGYTCDVPDGRSERASFETTPSRSRARSDAICSAGLPRSAATEEPACQLDVAADMRVLHF